MTFTQQFEIWFKEVKIELLATEPGNINARALCAQSVVNECIHRLNGRLQLPNIPLANHYVCRVQPNDHLQFLLSWPGLRINVNKPSKIPVTKKEYMKKSKNWLNGRRAPNYGRTLFPFFIEDAKSYIELVCDNMFGGGSSNSNSSTDDSCTRKNLYFRAAMYQILATLCASCVALHEQAKKSPFFCKNSLERKGKLRDILQSYAADHEYVQGFPSCFKAAVDYFENCSKGYIQEYMMLFLLNDNQRIQMFDMQSNNNGNSNDSRNIRRIQQLESTIRDLQSQVRFWRKEAQRFALQLSCERENTGISDQRMQNMFASSLPTTHVQPHSQLSLNTSSMCSTLSLISQQTSDASQVSVTSSAIRSCPLPITKKLLPSYNYNTNNQLFQLPLFNDCMDGVADYNTQSLFTNQVQLPNTSLVRTANLLDQTQNQNQMSDSMEMVINDEQNLSLPSFLTHDTEHAQQQPLIELKTPTLRCTASVNNSFMIEYMPISPMLTEPAVEHDEQQQYFSFSSDFNIDASPANNTMNNFVYDHENNYQMDSDIGQNSNLFSF